MILWPARHSQLLPWMPPLPLLFAPALAMWMAQQRSREVVGQGGPWTGQPAGLGEALAMERGRPRPWRDASAQPRAAEASALAAAGWPRVAIAPERSVGWKWVRLLVEAPGAERTVLEPSPLD